MKKPYRLGLDIGTNSIGWAALDLNKQGRPVGLRALGSRLFTDGRDPKTKATLATERRVARSARRRRDRYLRRRTVLMETLAAAGLMPTDREAAKRLEREDPYDLRKRGLDEALTPHEFGRALFHINQRRGFKSNRKADRHDKEEGLIRGGVRALREEIARTGARTVGEYLFKRREAGGWVRARPQGEGKEKAYAFYPHRDLMAAEFDALWAAQAAHHPALLTDELKDRIHRVIFYQRPLKPVDPGKCTFEEGEKRAPWAHPLAQRFRLLQELANLRIVDPDLNGRSLTPEERDIVLRDAFGEGRDHKPKVKVSFTRIRKLLGVPADYGFSHEDERRDHLKGDEVGAILTKVTHLGPVRWAKLDLTARAELVDRLLNVEDEDDLVGWLISEHGLEAEPALTTARKTPLPAGHIRFSVKALEKLVPVMERETVREHSETRPVRYDEAVPLADPTWHHSDFRTGEIFDELPYYGAMLPRNVVDAPPTVEAEAVRHGWIPNPTVHIGLNQLRKVVNGMIDRYGHPHEIVVELARELKQNKEQRDRARRTNTENAKRREEWRKRLASELRFDSPKGGDFMKMRLWEEMPAQRRHCVFCGRGIGIRDLFSDEIEVEHILPFSRSLDDGFMNKVLSCRPCNREKRNHTPYEAFGHTDRWEGILERISDLPKPKRDRFAPDAKAEPEEFLARHLNDTRYLSRVAKTYLSGVCHPDRVWVVPGRLTAMLRGKWGLNAVLSGDNVKTREDQRHHAIDAFVVALTDRGMLNRISRAAGLAEERGLDRIIDDMPDPWDGFDRDEFARRARKVTVSYKPDRTHQAQMHNDTAYGLTGRTDGRGVPEVAHRVPLDGIDKRAVLERVRDDRLRMKLLEIADKAGDGKALKEALAAFSKATGIRRVRVLENLQVIGIGDGSGAPYKAYKGDSNHCFAIRSDGNGRWKGEVESTFDAYRRIRDGMGAPGRPEPLFRLFKDDLVAIEDPVESGGRRILRVVKFSGNTLVTADHFEGGNLKARDADGDDPFKYLIKSPDWYRRNGMRRVRVNALGRVHDPGAPPRVAGG